jgi:hypothetical protein
MPLEFLRRLLRQATEAVRSRLMASFSPERAAEIRLVLAKISKKAVETVSYDFGAAERTVQSMKRAHKLNEQAVLLFAISNRYEHVVAALSLLTGAPVDLVDRLMHMERTEAVLVPCKAAGFEWATVRAIVKMKTASQPLSDLSLEQCRLEYGKLSMSTAGRVLRFWQVHEKHAGGRPNAEPTPLR